MIYKSVILPLFIALLFLGGLIAAHPTPTIYDNSFAISSYVRDTEHQNSSLETFETLFGHADPLKLWRFYPNCSLVSQPGLYEYDKHFVSWICS